MSDLRRFQIDLTVEELGSIERLGALAGLRTKKEVILNAITLFRWAAKEVLLGREICSVDEKTQSIKQLEIPALSAIVQKRVEPLSDAQVREQIASGGRPFAEFRPSTFPGGKSVAGILDSSSGGTVDRSVAGGSASKQ